MTATEKINLLEEKVGNYESWDENQLIEIIESDELKNLLDADVLSILIDRENAYLKPIIEASLIGILMVDASEKFENMLDELETDGEKVSDCLLEIINNEKSNLFERINAELVIVSNDEHLREDLYKSLPEETLRSDILRLQELMMGLDPELSMARIQELLVCLFKIQEYYFELTGTDILEPENKEFTEFCDKVSNAQLEILEALKTTLNELEEEDDEN